MPDLWRQLSARSAAGLTGIIAGTFCGWAVAQAPPADPPLPAPSASPGPSSSTPSTTAEPPRAPDQVAPPPAVEEPEEIETELRLVDGQRACGVLVERTSDRVVLLINGIRTPYSSDSIASMETLPTVAERYRQLRSKIDDADIDQRLMLAQWLRARRKYQFALDEVSGILGRDPRNPQALQLRTWLTQQLKLQARPATREGGPAARSAPQIARRPDDFPLLTPEQINLIRVFEVDLADPPRMMIDRDVVTGLINSFGNDPSVPASREGREALYRKQPAQILDLMFRLRARDFYGRVQVLSDPRSLKMFRERVHSTWLLNSCATNQCHGGQDAGRLYLATRQPNSDAVVYTNFLILDRFRLRPNGEHGATDGEKDKPGIPLIDYDEPARSPLLHLALSKNESLFPHPPVAAAGGRFKPINPVFNTVNDRRYQDAVEWIRAMYMPRPDYPVEYSPPVPGEAGMAVLGGVKKAKDDPLGGKR